MGSRSQRRLVAKKAWPLPFYPLHGSPFPDQLFNPNPGGLVENMTSKTQNCYDEFIIPKKI
jgi:hypothetical protein